MGCIQQLSGSIGTKTRPSRESTASLPSQVAQHFFALHLATQQDTLQMLQAMQKASVATDPTNPQVAKLSSGPAALLSAAKQLGRPLRQEQEPLQATMSVRWDVTWSIA